MRERLAAGWFIPEVVECGKQYSHARLESCGSNPKRRTFLAFLIGAGVIFSKIERTFFGVLPVKTFG